MDIDPIQTEDDVSLAPQLLLTALHLTFKASSAADDTFLDICFQIEDPKRYLTVKLWWCVVHQYTEVSPFWHQELLPQSRFREKNKFKLNKSQGHRMTANDEAAFTVVR